MAKTLTRLPTVAFSGLDYDNIMTDIINLVTDNPNYNENWSDFLSSDAGRMLIELFAYIGDATNTRIDWVANEVFIGTSTQKSSMIRLLKVLGYSFTLPYASKVGVKTNITAADWALIAPDGFNLTEGYTNGDSTWSPYSLAANDKKGIQRTYELISYNSITEVYNYTTSVAVTNSGESDLNFYEGVTTIETFTATSDNSPSFTLTGSPIIENSILVRLIGDSNQETNLLKVNSFLSPNAQNEQYANGDTIPIPYILIVNEDETVSVEFGSTSLLSSSTRRLSVGQNIRVLCRIGGGVDGNLSKNAIPPETAKSMYVTPIGGGAAVNITPTFYNPAAGTGGADGETAEHAAVYAPLSIRTAEKTVTQEDYSIILDQHSDIITSKSYGGLNMPSNFYDLYGEYIKPLEVWNFLVPNTTGYIELSPSVYSDFQWMSYRLENMFNGIYNFSSGSFNNSVTVTTSNINLGDSFIDWYGDTIYTWYQNVGDSFYDGDTESGVSDADSYNFTINTETYKIKVYNGDSTDYTAIKDYMNTVIADAGDSFIVSIVGDTGEMDLRVSLASPFAGGGDSMITLSHPSGDTLWTQLSAWGDSFRSQTLTEQGDTFFNFVIVQTPQTLKDAVINAITGDSYIRIKVSSEVDTTQQFKNIPSLIVGDSMLGDTYTSTTWKISNDISAFFRSNVNIEDGVDMSTNYNVELSFDGDTYVTINLRDGAVDPSRVRSYEMMYNVNIAFFNNEGYGDSGDTTWGDSDGLTGVASVIEVGDSGEYLYLSSPKIGDSSKVSFRILDDLDTANSVFGSIITGDTGDSFTCYGKIGLTVVTKQNSTMSEKLIYEPGTINFVGDSQDVYIHFLTSTSDSIALGDYFYNTYGDTAPLYRTIARRIYNSNYTTATGDSIGDSVIDVAQSNFILKFTKSSTTEMSIYVVGDSWDLTQAAPAYVKGDTALGGSIVIDTEWSLKLNIDGLGDTTVDVTNGDSSATYTRAQIIYNINTILQTSYENQGSPYTSATYASFADNFLKITSPTISASSSVKVADCGDSDASGVLLGLAISGDSVTYNINGDYFLRYDGDSNMMRLIKVSGSDMPDADFYCHFVNDRRSEIHSSINVIDEEDYRDYLYNKKVIGIENEFKPTKFSVFDIEGTIHYNETYSRSQVESAVESMLFDEYTLLNSNNEAKMIHGQEVYKSKLLDKLHGVTGVEYVELTYFGIDATDSSTNRDNYIPCRFDEILLLSERRADEGGITTHGPIFTYSVVEE